MPQRTLREMMIGDSLNFRRNLATELPTGTAIDDSEWILDAGLTLAVESFTSTTTLARITFSGTVGQLYSATNRVTLDDGQVRDFTVTVKGVERIFRLPKDPNATEDFEINWETTGIFAVGETVASAAFTVPAGLTEEASSGTARISVVRLSGGTLDEEYSIPASITTTASQVAKCILLLTAEAE